MAVKWERRDNHQNNTVHTDFLFVALTSSPTGHCSTCGYRRRREEVHMLHLFSGMETDADDSNCKETVKN